MNKAVINIFDHISTYGISSKKILETLDNLKSQNITELEVRINSAGGSVFEGFSIFNQLRDFGNVTTVIDGIAASIASVIALAGDNIKAYKNSYLFIHNPWTIAIGDHNDMQDTSNDLSKFRDTLIDIYKSKTGMSEEELKNMTDSHTFISSEEALELGLIDEIIDNYRTSDYVALHTEIFDDDNNIIIPEDSVNADDNKFFDDKLVDADNTAKDLLNVVSNLKESFSNLKDDLTQQLDNSVQLKIDIAKFESQLDNKINSGILLPSVKNAILDIINFILSDHAPDDDQTKVLMSKFDALINEFPNMMLLDDIATNKNDSNSVDSDEFDSYSVDDDSYNLHKKALAFSKKNNISYKDAIISISKLTN